MARADLSVGGRVVGNTVACPFHNWQFAGDGRCVKIPYCDKIPKKAATRAWPVCERDDVGGISIPLQPQVGKGAIFIYDGYPGGVGLAGSQNCAANGSAGTSRRRSRPS